MVVRAQIGYSPHMGIFVLRLGFFVRLLFVFRDVVDALFVFLSVGVDHRGSVAAPRITFSLHVPFLFAIAAHDVRVTRAVAACRARAASLRLIGVAERLLTTHSGDLVEVLGLQFIPKNSGGLLGLHDGLESGNLLRAFPVIMDGLQLSGELQASWKSALPASRTQSHSESLMPAKKSWCLKNKAMSFIPSAFTWASVAPAAMVFLTVVMVAGLLSRRRS
jgi:hypothetical protein